MFAQKPGTETEIAWGRITYWVICRRFKPMHKALSIWTFETDSSAALSNIFNEKSVFYIQVFSISVFLIICGIISAEFAISITKIKDSSDRVEYMNKAYHLLNSLVYTKFFLTEAIACQQNYTNENISYKNMGGMEIEEYANDMMAEMAKCRDKQ